MHDFVAPAVIDEGVPRLNGVHDRLCRWRFEQGTQFHEVMTGAARIKAVKRDKVLFAAIERATVLDCHRCDPAIRAAALQFHVEAKQISPFVAGIDFFHHSFDFIG